MTATANLNTAYTIICDSMTDVGKLRAGSEPNSEDIAANMRRLNKLINFYMTQGLKLWLIEDISIPLVAGQGLYTLGPSGNVPMQKPLRVLSGYYLDQFNNQQPLLLISYAEYKLLSNTGTPASLSSFMVDKQQSTLNVYLWNPPDAFTSSNGSVHLIVENSVTNFQGITDQMNFPIEWALLLEWGLADQISTGQPTTIIAKAAANEVQYREALEGWDVEDAATMFQPDQRMYQTTGRFK